MSLDNLRTITEVNVNEFVMAYHEQDKMYYPALIREYAEDNRYLIMFMDGKTQKLKREWMYPCSSSHLAKELTAARNALNARKNMGVKEE